MSPREILFVLNWFEQKHILHSSVIDSTNKYIIKNSRKLHKLKFIQLIDFYILCKKHLKIGRRPSYNSRTPHINSANSEIYNNIYRTFHKYIVTSLESPNDGSSKGITVEAMLDRYIKQYSEDDRVHILDLIKELGYNEDLKKYYRKDLENIGQDDLQNFIFITSQVDGNYINYEDEQKVIDILDALPENRIPGVAKVMSDCRISNTLIWDALKMNLTKQIENESEPEYVAESLTSVYNSYKFDFSTDFQPFIARNLSLFDAIDLINIRNRYIKQSLNNSEKSKEMLFKVNDEALSFVSLWEIQIVSLMHWFGRTKNINLLTKSLKVII